MYICAHRVYNDIMYEFKFFKLITLFVVRTYFNLKDQIYGYRYESGMIMGGQPLKLLYIYRLRETGRPTPFMLSNPHPNPNMLC